MLTTISYWSDGFQSVQPIFVSVAGIVTALFFGVEPSLLENTVSVNTLTHFLTGMHALHAVFLSVLILSKFLNFRTKVLGVPGWLPVWGLVALILSLVISIYCSIHFGYVSSQEKVPELIDTTLSLFFLALAAVFTISFGLMLVNPNKEFPDYIKMLGLLLSVFINIGLFVVYSKSAHEDKVRVKNILKYALLINAVFFFLLFLYGVSLLITKKYENAYGGALVDPYSTASFAQDENQYRSQPQYTLAASSPSSSSEYMDPPDIPFGKK